MTSRTTLLAPARPTADTTPATASATALAAALLAVTEPGAGRVRPVGSHHVHRVTNRGTRPAVSVHVYTPGPSLVNRFELEDGELRLLSTERAGVDW